MNDGAAVENRKLTIWFKEDVATLDDAKRALEPLEVIDIWNVCRLFNTYFVTVKTALSHQEMSLVLSQKQEIKNVVASQSGI